MADIVFLCRSKVFIRDRFTNSPVSTPDNRRYNVRALQIRIRFYFSIPTMLAKRSFIIACYKY